jgi:hypothetical protein
MFVTALSFPDNHGHRDCRILLRMRQMGLVKIFSGQEVF